MQQINLQEITFKRKNKESVRQSHTDWVLFSHKVLHKTEHEWTSFSDHCAIKIAISIPENRPGASHIVTIDKQITLAGCRLAELGARNTEEFLKIQKELLNQQKPLKKIRLRLKEKKPQRSDLTDLAHKIDTTIRSKHSKTAFNIISHMTIIHPTKRDGGVMNCFIDEQGEVIVDSKQVLKQCIETIGKHSTIVDTPKLDEVYFPRLQPLPLEEVSYLQQPWLLLIKPNASTSYLISG
jgi:hypothetical protein